MEELYRCSTCQTYHFEGEPCPLVELVLALTRLANAKAEELERSNRWAKVHDEASGWEAMKKP